MEQEIDRLLNDVAFKMGTLREARNRFSAQLAPEFRIFDFLRTDEMGLSRCIASLLNPNGTHGQGRVFLAAFLNKVGPESSWMTTAEDCKVETEKQANGQRRIDIYMNFPKAGVLGIENKPWADDQNQQLSDYADFLEAASGNKKWLLIYLSNCDPSEESITTHKREMLEEYGQFVRLTYTDIIEWLDYCAGQSKALVVRVFIEELAKFIRMNINGELDMSEEIEMKRVILKSPESLSSAFQVFKAMDGAKKELLKQFHDELDDRLKVHSMKLGWELDGWQAYKGFIIRFDELPQTLNLRFEFDKTNLNAFFWGIAKNNKDYNDSHVWDEVNKLMSSSFGSTKGSDYWPWYSVLPDHEFAAAMENWQISEEPWIAIMDKNQNENLAAKITNLALRVQEVFKDHLYLLRERDTATAIRTTP